MVIVSNMGALGAEKGLLDHHGGATWLSKAVQIVRILCADPQSIATGRYLYSLLKFKENIVRFGKTVELKGSRLVDVSSYIFTICEAHCNSAIYAGICCRSGR